MNNIIMIIYLPPKLTLLAPNFKKYILPNLYREMYIVKNDAVRIWQYNHFSSE